MGSFQAEAYEKREDTLSGWPVQITSYKLGDVFHCHVDNVSPGATVSRGQGATRDEAVQIAVDKATERLAATRRRAT